MSLFRALALSGLVLQITLAKDSLHNFCIIRSRVVRNKLSSHFALACSLLVVMHVLHTSQQV